MADKPSGLGEVHIEDVLLRLAAAAGGCAIVVIGLLLLRDLEFQIFVFENLSAGAIAGSWLDLWRWALGLVNAGVAGLLFHVLERGNRLSAAISLLLAWVAGTLITVIGTLGALAILLAIWFVIGLIIMLFAGPF